MATSSVAPFGVLLRQYRAAAGLTQEALAERARLSARAVSDLERGINRTPRRETLTLLADALALPGRQRTLLAAAAYPIAQAATFAPTPPGARTGNLPIPPTPLVGREAEVARATQLLKRPDVRLLTLTGLGGVGKTRLALQIADDLSEDFDDGTYVVALASVSDPEHVPSAIASALTAGRASAQLSAEHLREYLRPLCVLLLLDNFEHLASAAMQIASLLAFCPRLKLLVTSRAPLRLRAEHEMPVSPLPLDVACVLFQQRALAVLPDLELTDGAFAAETIRRSTSGLRAYSQPAA